LVLDEAFTREIPYNDILGNHKGSSIYDVHKNQGT